jgi:parvulin-like peptidyl-prolyl isomerase
MTLEEIVAAQLYTMDEYRAVIRGTLLAQKLSDVVANVSPYAPQVHSRHILVKDEATARALIQQIQGGTDFAELAVQYSLDGSTARTGGDLDWVSEGDLLQKEVEDAIFALEPGQLALEPVQSSLGYHVIQVLERVEDRPLSPAALAEKRQQAFLEWLDNERQTAVIERFVGLSN